MPGYIPQSSTPPPQTSGDNSNNFSSDINNTMVNPQTPGLFGTDTFQASPYQINANSFVNPVSTEQSASGFTTGQNQLLAAANGSAPVIGPTGTSNGPGTSGELGVANTLTGIGTGAIPGAAAKQAATQTQADTAANLSALGSARGTANPALAGYQVAQNNAATQRTTTNAATNAAAQEQIAALGGANTAYGGVQQNTQFNQQQIQAKAIAQAQFQATQLGLQGQELQNYVSNNAGQIANSMSAAQAGQSLAVNENLGINNINSNAFGQSAKQAPGYNIMNSLGSIAGAAGAVLMSDKTKKKNIKAGKETLDKFLTFIAEKN